MDRKGAISREREREKERSLFPLYLGFKLSKYKLEYVDHGDRRVGLSHCGKLWAFENRIKRISRGEFYYIKCILNDKVIGRFYLLLDE